MIGEGSQHPTVNIALGIVVAFIQLHAVVIAAVAFLHPQGLQRSGDAGEFAALPIFRDR